MSDSNFHFPTDIALEHNPLVEAWLEIRWQLTPGPLPDSEVDQYFPFALGAFYKKIKKQYRHNESLPQSEAPIEFLPYVVRYRFRKQKNAWPVLQLGPGIATVNFTSPYTWNDFRKQALYLRKNLIDAYARELPRVTNLILRYRNAVNIDYISSNSLESLAKSLNLNIQPPGYVPGKVAKVVWPRKFNVNLTYDLSQPEGIGTISIATGTQKRKNDKTYTQPIIAFEIAVESLNHMLGNAYWETNESFDSWLMSAHAVTHEWFFAFIDGSLRESFTQGE